MRRFQFVSPLILLALSVAVGCNIGDVNHKSWESLSETEILEAIQAPTGEFDSGEIDEVVALLNQRMPAVLEAIDFLGYLASVISRTEKLDPADQQELPPTAEVSEPKEGENWGTSFYVQVACPGDRNSPSYDFENGAVRIDSPELRGVAGIDSLEEGGEFLLTYSDCQLGDLNLDGEYRGRYVSELSYVPQPTTLSESASPRVALVIDADNRESVAEGAVGMFAIACGTEAESCASAMSAAVEIKLEGVGTYVVLFQLTREYWTGSALSLEIRGSEEAFKCTYALKSGHRNLVCELQG